MTAYSLIVPLGFSESQNSQDTARRKRQQGLTSLPFKTRFLKVGVNATQIYTGILGQQMLVYILHIVGKEQQLRQVNMKATVTIQVKSV